MAKKKRRTPLGGRRAWWWRVPEKDYIPPLKLFNTRQYLHWWWCEMTLSIPQNHLTPDKTYTAYHQSNAFFAQLLTFNQIFLPPYCFHPVKSFPLWVPQMVSPFGSPKWFPPPAAASDLPYFFRLRRKKRPGGLGGPEGGIR